MRFVILGAGAVGGVIGGLLWSAGHDVVLVARGPHLSALQEQGLTLERPEGRLQLPVPALATPSIGARDVVILAVKSQDTDTALQGVPPGTTVVCAQNGVENEELALARGPVLGARGPVLGMLVWMFALHLEPGVVALYGSGSPGVLDLGPWPNSSPAPESPAIAEALRSAGFDVQVRKDIRSWKFGKLLCNLPGALAALGRARPGGSLWQSRQRGAASEVQWLTGFIVELGKKFGVPTPRNAEVLAASDFRGGRSSSSIFRDQDSRAARLCCAAMKTEFTLITGASSGLGLEMSRILAAEGRNLMILARREERLAEIAEELSASGAGEVRSFAVDLSETEALESFLARIERDELAIDTLINNAGFGLRGSFAELGCEDQMRCIDLNIRALTRLTHAVLPGMLARGRGAILNVASTAAFQPGPGMAVYYASKAYVLSFTEALAQELREQGIRVTCLCPGPTDTEFAQVAGMVDSPLFRAGAMDATFVSRQGLRALQRGQVIHLPGMRNKTLAFLLRFTPRSWVRRLVAKLQ